MPTKKKIYGSDACEICGHPNSWHRPSLVVQKEICPTVVSRGKNDNKYCDCIRDAEPKVVHSEPLH